MEKFLLAIFVSNFLCGFVQSAAYKTKRNREFFTIHYLEDKQIVPVRVILNSEEQTEHVRSSRGGETLYDFNRGKVAYKDANSSQCFIADIAEESLEADRKRLKKLKNGIVRGYYIPTFIILEEFVNVTRLSKTAGDRLSQFCDGNDVSLVERQRPNRRKRSTPDDKGQFTHHSYGHYGHQSNNYAHYGHETYITGKVDKDGQIRNQGIRHQQVTSEGSQGYPGDNLRNGQSGGPSVSTTDSRTGISSPHYQNQYQMPNYQQSLGGNGRNTGMGGSGQFSLQTGQESGYQLNLPLGLTAGNAYRSGIRSSGQYGVGGLQPHISTEFQRYPGYTPSTSYRPGVLSTHGQLSPPVSLTPGKSFRPSTTDQAGLTAEEQAKIRQRTIIPGYQDFGSTKVAHRLPGLPDTGLEPSPSLKQSGISPPYSPASTLDRGLPQQPGIDASGIHTGQGTIIPIGQTRGVDKVGYDTQDRKYVDQAGQIPSKHGVPPSTDGLGLHRPYYPGSGIQPRGIQAPVFTPGASIPSMQIPSRGIQETGISAPGSVSGIQIPGFYTDSGIPSRTDGSSALPGQTLPGIYGSGAQTIGVQQYIPGSITTPQQLGPGVTYPNGDTRTRSQVPLYPPSTMPGQIYPGSAQTFQPASTVPGSGTQQYIPGSIPPIQQSGQVPGLTYPTEDRRIRSQVPLHLLSTIPGQIYPGGSHTSQPVSTVPGSQTFVPGSAATYDQTASGTQYPDSPYYPQSIRGVRTDYTRGVIPSQESAVPQDIKSSQISRGQSVDRQFIPGATGPIPPDGTSVYQAPGTSRQDGTIPSTRDSSLLTRGTDARLFQPGDRRTTISQTGGYGLGLYGQDSASSQTQIQTGLEGTAGEAAAAGQYRGLGSQTQVQGGYAGNGSFSAQAQSGFTGGVVQSQVQGSKLGGLSGSSSQVERVGSAQSQVQVGQPSGAASSTAQGRFSGGTTQVQAQSGKAGGSAGAQAQSTGLSSSHVQVNIGGNDIRDKDRFQGTVSASVQGGHSSGQSQTQLQGGYESGRTYAATAQGGFDSLQGFQGSVPQTGSLTGFSNGTEGIGQFPGTIRSQTSQQTNDGRPATGSLPQRIPAGIPFDGAQTSQISPRDQTTDGRVYARPGSTFPDQRPLLSGQIPPQQPADVTHQTYFPTRADGSRIQYPSSEIPSHTYPSYQLARHPDYPASVSGVPTGTTSERGVSIRHGVPGYEGYSPDGTRTGMPQISDHETRLKQTTPHLPTSVQDISHATRFGQGVSSDLSYPSQITGTFQRPTQQQYPQQPTAGIFSQAHPLPDSSTSGIPYKPGYTSGSIPQLQVPGLVTDQLPHVYGYPQGFVPQQPDTPVVQMPHISGYPIGSVTQSHRPDLRTDQGLPTLSYPTGSVSQPHGPGKTTDQLPHTPGYLSGLSPQPQMPSTRTGVGQPGSTSAFQTGLYPFQPPPLFPGEPQISPPFPQTVPSSHRPDGIASPDKPDTIRPPSLQPGVQLPLPSPVGQPKTRPDSPQILQPSPVSESVKPITSDIPLGRPGVSEPDESNCCKALRDLKRRCCNGASQNNGASSCCKSTDQDDIFDFSSEDKLDEKSDGQCKVVKAICYIVYKPVGKARVCKPTQTNGC